jgi:hypothetical protein
MYRQRSGQDEPEVSEEEQAIAEVLGDNPRAQELRDMRMALEQRRDGMRRDRERAQDPKEQTRMNARIQELEKQIEALRQEEGITKFVENSVRVTLHQAAGDELDQD